MAPQWRLNDTARRRAIHAYIRAHRKELMAELSGKVLQDRNAKRNELVRVGRVRFAALPQEVQTRFLDAVPAAVPKSPAVDGVPASRCSGGDGSSAVPVAMEVDGVQASRSSGQASPLVATPHALQRVAMEVDGVPASRSSGQARTLVATPHALQRAAKCSTKKLIMEEFAFLQKTFPSPAVFDVLASTFRLLDLLCDEMKTETDRVKAAVCLGFGAKLASVGLSHTFQIWTKFAGARMLPYLKSVELRVMTHWARRGL